MAELSIPYQHGLLRRGVTVIVGPSQGRVDRWPTPDERCVVAWHDNDRANLCTEDGEAFPGIPTYAIQLDCTDALSRTHAAWLAWQRLAGHTGLRLSRDELDLLESARRGDTYWPVATIDTFCRLVSRVLTHTASSVRA